MNKNLIIILIIILLFIGSANAITGTVTVLPKNSTPTPTPTPTQILSYGSSSGGSSGGSGVIVDENFINIESHYTIEKDVSSRYDTTFSFSGTTIYEVVIKKTENEVLVSGRVDDLVARSSRTPTQPDGEVYKFVNAYIGTKRFGSAELRFKVPVSWTLNKNMQMLIWQNNVWIPLETTKLSEDSEYAYFSAITNHFTNFVIVGKQSSVPEVVPVVTTQPTTVPTEVIQITPVTTEETKSGFNATAAIAFVLILVAVVYIFMRKK